MPVKISVGIIAWNEEHAIAGSIESVFAQSLLREIGNSVDSLEIICLPNGCTDRTQQVARETLERLVEPLQQLNVRTGVRSLDKPSKENAWNRFVHEYSDPRADYLVLMDGDVRIQHPDTLDNLIEVLESDTEARIAGARTVKHIELERRASIGSRLSLAASSLRRQRRGELAGALYCARASVLREFELPSILTGEDSFINAMIRTDFFTRPGKPERVASPANATVLFESYTSPVSVLKNLRRRAVEIAINSFIYDELWAYSKPERHAGKLLREWHTEDPLWGEHLIERKISERGAWVMPKGMLWKWIRRCSSLPWRKRFKHLPIAIVATLPHVYVCVAANQRIRSRRLKGLWFSDSPGQEVLQDE